MTGGVFYYYDENMDTLIKEIKTTQLAYSGYWLNQLAKLNPKSQRYNQLVQNIKYHLTAYQSRNKLIQQTKISYPLELPVSREVDSIKQLIANNQVSIICGETGSGKTTQLPKILLEMGYAERGLIGHTQPRRIAARSLATRINQELGFTTNYEQSLVGYKMRFHDKTSPATAIKLMTDGILLQEIQNDKLLLQYSALVIDEVHERSLNIDFILGYLKTLLKRRPDLKVIITSATLENAKLAEFFATDAVLNVSGKTYPVDIIYQPFNQDDEDEISLNQAIYQAIVAALEVERGNGLVFLPGEREIKQCLQFLRKTTLKTYELLPLYARQNNEEQAQIFSNNGRIKIILATNIAETSLTIPGVKFVIDTGIARVKRYSTRNRVEQLQIENISQASSKQRAGRAGRVSHGLCVRLFDESEFNLRKAYTEPELLRSNLANVILRLLSLNLGEPATFPFLDLPENKAFNDGFRTLFQVGAIDKQNHITMLGRKLATIPIDVQLARILLASGEKFACLHEALIIVSFLAIQDPREFPVEHQQLVRERHGIWADKQSDFMQIINLWNWYHNELTHKKSNKKLLETCHKQFVSLLRLREWHELHRQLKETMLSLGCKENTQPASYENLHRALLTGFIVNIGQKDLVENYYLSTNGRKFYLHPSLHVNSSKWMMTASLVETTRLYARHCAGIETQWLNGIANHLYRYVYSNQHWESKRGEVVATKTALLYGLAIYQERISYGRIDAELARALMIREGMVCDNLGKDYPFLKHNNQVIRAVEKLEDKLRTSLAMIEDELYNFYADKLPLDIIDRPSLENYLQDHPQQLYLNQEQLIDKLVSSQEYHQLYPDYVFNNGNKIRLQYIFDHDSNEDGVVAAIELATLGLIDDDLFAWLVPGMIRDKITYLIKSLPKATRLQFNPVQDSVSEFLDLADNEGNLIQQFVDYAKQYKNLTLNPINLRDVALPTQLRFHFRILDNKRIIATGDDLALLKTKLAPKLDKIVVKHTAAQQINNITDWRDEFLLLLQEQTIMAGKSKLIGFNSLIIEKDGLITYGVVAELGKARLSTQKALIQLVKLQLKEQHKYLQSKKIAGFNEISLAFSELYSKEQLVTTCSSYIISQAILQNLPTQLAIDKAAFLQLVANSRQSVGSFIGDFARVLQSIAQLYRQVKLRLAGHSLEESIQLQLENIIYADFIRYTKWQFLQQYPRYLQGVLVRLDKYVKSPSRDEQYEDEVNALYDKWYNYVEQLEEKNKTISSELYDFSYKIEELRISLFAQEIKTLYPVSSKRLVSELEQLYLSNL